MPEFCSPNSLIGVACKPQKSTLIFNGGEGVERKTWEMKILMVLIDFSLIYFKSNLAFGLASPHFFLSCKINLELKNSCLNVGPTANIIFGLQRIAHSISNF